MKRVSQSAREKLKAYDYQVYHSLIRSSVRIDVLVFFLEHPERAMIQDIADRIHATYANTWGACIGGTRKYKKTSSLLNLRLIIREKAGNTNAVLYRLTPKGHDVARMLEGVDLDRDV